MPYLSLINITSLNVYALIVLVYKFHILNLNVHVQLTAVILYQI